MAIDDLRVLLTVLEFVAFIGVVVWACSPSRTSAFEKAAWLPFEGEEAGGEDRQGRSAKGQSR